MNTITSHEAEFDKLATKLLAILGNSNETLGFIERIQKLAIKVRSNRLESDQGHMSAAQIKKKLERIQTCTNDLQKELADIMIIEDGPTTLIEGASWRAGSALHAYAYLSLDDAQIESGGILKTSARQILVLQEALTAALEKISTKRGATSEEFHELKNLDVIIMMNYYFAYGKKTPTLSASEKNPYIQILLSIYKFIEYKNNDVDAVYQRALSAKNSWIEPLDYKPMSVPKGVHPKV